MKSLLFLITVVALLPSRFEDRWVLQEPAGLMILALILSIKLYKKFHWSVVPPFLITIGYGLYQWAIPSIAFKSLGPVGSAAWASSVVGAIFTLLFFTAAALALKTQEIKKVLPVFLLIACLNALICIVRGLSTGIDNAFWMSVHPSVDGCLSAIFIPYALHLRDKTVGRTMAAILVSSAIMSKSSTALAAVFIGVLVFSLLSMKLTKSNVFMMVIGALLAVGSARWYLGGELLNPNGRYHNWWVAMDFFKQAVNPIIGAGPGTYYLYGPGIELIDRGMPKESTGIFFWMHNDWLQVFFEQGILGLVSVVILFLNMLKKSIGKPWLFSMIVVYGFEALTQMPLRMFYFQLLGVLLICEAFTVDLPLWPPQTQEAVL